LVVLAAMLEFPAVPLQNHVLYRLGPTFRPYPDVLTGKIFRNGRRWRMVDALFTCPTISDAATQSLKREREATKSTP
jgi:hypothetical protein